MQLAKAAQDEYVITPSPSPEGAGLGAVSPTQISTQAPTPTEMPATTSATAVGDSPLTPNVTPAPTQAASQPPLVPDKIMIPAINLDASIIQVVSHLVALDQYPGMVFQQWQVPNEYSAGWLPVSGTLGAGNMVLDGHHNEYGEVFGKLVDLSPGDMILVQSGNAIRSYQITNKMILPERGEPLSIRAANADWLLPTPEERLTLVTCWPYWTNTHRLIIVARPVAWIVPPSQP